MSVKSLSCKLYRPKLMTEDGHLYIIAAEDKNVTFRTSGNGFVNLNGDNLLNLAVMARRASNVVERFDQNTLPSIEKRLQILYNQISGPQGITAKMATLEQTVSSGNMTPSSGGPIPGAQRLALPARLNRITTRLRSVELHLRDLRNLLTIDECLSNPCRNGGTCMDLFNGFVCTCPSNWQGTLCDEDVNECAEFAGSDWGCKNGATCVNKPGSYECLCADTFFGLHCTLRTNDCSVANSARLCGNGVCVNQGGNGRGYVCICNEGWTTDLSQSCTVDIDECQSKRYPCSHDPFVQCINLPGTYHCGFCPQGYTGNGFQCSDINECLIDNGGCSIIPKVSCHNTRGSRYCDRCPPGYSGDGVMCSPVSGGSCAMNNGNCYPTAQCFENAGIISCRCPEGHVGDGYGPSGCSPTALLPNPCHINPCKSGGTCVVVSNRAHCLCHPHLTGPDCSAVVYASCNPNPCNNNGNCTIQIVQGVPQVACTCPSGLEGRLCETVSSDCGGMFYQDSGVLQVPLGNNFQRYEGGQSCTWRIEVDSYKVVLAYIDHIHLDSEGDCAQNYLRLSGPLGVDGEYREFCSSLNNEEVLIKSTNVLFVKFKSSSGINKNSFKIRWIASKTDCGGVLYIDTHGTIESPFFPQNYPPNQRCEWKLLAQPGKKIQLLFETLDLESSPNCGKDYLKVQEYEDDEPSSVLAKLCNSSNPTPITTHFPAAYLLFHTDSGGSGKGFKITYTLLDGCGGVLTNPTGSLSPPLGFDGKYNGDLDCEWKIQLPMGDKIKISFNTFDLEDREECDDYVEVRDGPTATSPVVGRWCGSSLPPTYISSANSITVIFHSDFVISGSGFTLQYETVCGGEFTDLTGEIKSPNYPLSYYAERECIFLISSPPNTAIRLQFQDFELEDLGSECDYDFVEIRDGENNNATVIGRYCGSELPPPVLSTFNYLYIVFTSDASYQHRGFIANYSTIDIPCGGILKETTGILSSPQTEEGYLPNTKCTWLISAPLGWAIQLSWLSFHLEYSRDCQMDAVEVYENKTTSSEGLLIDKYCGLKIPPSTTSTTNLMTIKFRSDDSVHREGFTANYIMVDTSKVCGGTYRSIYGHIESPNYPNDYSENKECIWIIHVSQGQQIKLTFEDFMIEGDKKSCIYDSLEIRNGLSETSPLIGKYCGSTTPPDVTSLTNSLWLHFSSDRSISTKGFRATWDAASTGCGGTLTGPSGSITSPNYPQPYARFAECFFRITISHGSQVRLTIVDIDLEPNNRCSLDFIEVFDGMDDRSKSLGRFCSVNHPANIVASSNNMFLKFKSDISFSGRGFHVKYQAECNTTLKSHYGVLESPNYPQNYPPNLNCRWMIQAPAGNKLNISFVHFDVEGSARPYSSNPNDVDCRYDYLEISEGTKNQTASNVLGRFCGSDTPKTLSSMLDQVYVHFLTDHMIEGSGFRLEWAVSGCGGIYKGKPKGTITSPNYPNSYPNEVECEWLITAPWDKSIEVTVTDMQMEDIAQCSYDYLAIYGGEDDTAPVLMKACHRQTSPVVYTTSGNHLFMRFVSDYAVSGKGFSASWKFVDSRCGGKFKSLWGEIHSHNYPQNYDNHDDCEWLIQVPSNHLINLTFIDFDVEPSSSSMTTDYVNVYDGDSVKAPLLLSHNGNNLPDPPFIISTNNTILVRHKADGSVTAKGFRAQYAISCGARIVAHGVGTFALDDSYGSSSPHAEDHNTNCTWYLSAEDPADKIILTFTFLDVGSQYEYNETTCLSTYIEVLDGDDVNAPVLSRICGTKTPPPLRSSGSALTVQVLSNVDRFNSLLPFGRFTALYSTYSTACGGELTSAQGAIASPNYPDGYPENTDCEWEIKASVGNKVSLTFLSFELEKSDFCNVDYLEIRSDASNGTLQGVFCGDETPNNITAANTLWLRFRSDSMNTAKGFMAQYSLVNGVDLEGDSGQIASPMFPKPFVQSGQYKWTISVAANKVVRITFSDFYTDKYADNYCSVYLQVYDGPSAEESPSLMQACGAGLPPPVLSTSNVVTLVLMNEPWILGSYFLLSWEAVPPKSAVATVNTTTEENTLGCGQVIHISSTAENNTAKITSPGYPKNYVPDLQCAWIIDTTKGFHLKLQFIVLNLEQFDDCDADFVRVYTESLTDLSGWMPLTPNLCYPNSTSLDLVGGNRMKMYFETDSSDEKPGFTAIVTSVCGDTLTDPSGEIDTTIIEANLTTGRIMCEWKIKVTSGRTIQFSFDKFNLPTLGEDACLNNYIMFRDGGYNDSPMLGSGKYCGRAAPIIPQTISNRAFISYSAMASAPGLLLRYQEVDFSCKNVISLDSMPNETISSPNYPQPPSLSHITCTWLVSAPPGQSIHLDFVSRFDLKMSTSCTVEYIEVRDGGTDISPLIGRYCGSTPPPIVSQGNHMYIKYFTDADIPNNGFKAVVKIATCGGTFFDQNKVTLLSPLYPKRYPPNLDCQWRIVGAYGVLQFNVTDLVLSDEINEVCENAKDYIEIINVDPVTQNVSDGKITRLCGQVAIDANSSALVPSSSSNEVLIRFHSSSQERNEPRKRFAITILAKRTGCFHEIEAPSGIITSPGYPNPFPRGTSVFCSWIIKVPKDRLVTFKLLDFDLQPLRQSSFWSGNKLSFYGPLGTYITSLTSNISNIGKTIDSNSYMLRVHYWEETVSGAHKGFKAEFSSDKPNVCGGDLNENGTVTFSPVNLNLTTFICEWRHSQDTSASNQSTFTVTLDGTLNVNSTGVCSLLDATIIIYNKIGAGTVLTNVCDNVLKSVTIRNPYPQISVIARKGASYFSFSRLLNSSLVASFSISYKTDKCGGMVDGPEAVITSPGFPGQYPPNVDCAWLVTFQPDTRIQVSFEVLDLDMDCTKEFLTLYNGNSQTRPHLTAPLCGNSLPTKVFQTQGHQMLVEFHSAAGVRNPPNSHRGFKLTVSQDDRGCGGEIHLLTGEIQSPNYGKGDYPNNTECDWTITLPTGFHAGVSFRGRFSLETSTNCSNDYVQIFDWRDGKWEQIGSNICGRTSPVGIKTTNNQFRVLFRTNSVITSDGFKLLWTNLCGTEIQVTNEGSIVSPQFPKAYTGNLNCNYTILAPGKMIYGEFKVFEIEDTIVDDGTKCRFDNVTLHTYSVSRWLLSRNLRPAPSLIPMETLHCGSEIPEPVYSYNKLNLVFRTDPYLELKGFLFKYSLANCGGNITSPTIVKSPNNPHFRECTWYITAPEDKVVVIKVQKMDLYLRACSLSDVKFYEGHNVTNSSSMIDKMCSNAPRFNSRAHKKTRYLSLGNKMTIQYISKLTFPVLFQAAVGFTYGVKQKCGGVLQLADLTTPYTLTAPDVDGDGKYEPLLTCDWLLLAPESHQIRVVFDRLDIHNCSTENICDCDFLEIRDGDSEVQPLIGRYCGSSTYPYIVSSTGKLLIHFSSDGDVQLFGFQLSITTFLSPCGLTVRNATTEAQVLHSPGYPSSTDNTLSCLWSITAPSPVSGQLYIRLTDLDLASPCSRNYLSIRELYVEAPTKLCGNRTIDMTFSSRGLQLQYVTNRATTHRGFSLEYKIKGCSGNYSTSFGRITSNFFVQSGPTSCKVLIQVPQPNATISLYFNSFLCFGNAKMNVYDGLSENDREVASLCANLRPNPIFSTGPALFIKFDSPNRMAKYDMTYTATDQGRGCGGRFSDLSGRFSSPLYPSEYKKDSACRWDVSVPHGYKITFTFVYFDIGPTHTCNSNYIQFFDISSSTQTETSHSRYCGNDKPATIQMNGDSAYVRYVTTPLNNGTGWILTWSTT